MSLAQTSIRYPPSAGRLSLVSAYKILKPYSRPERSPTPNERDLLARVLDILLPTVLEPFEDHGQVEETKVLEARAPGSATTEVEQRMLTTLTDFVDRMPSLLAFKLGISYTSPSSALTQAMGLRMNGTEHRAACLLQWIVKDPLGSTDWTRLQFCDSLWRLCLLGSYRQQPAPSVGSMTELSLVQCALLALFDAGKLFSGRSTSQLFRMCINSEIQDRVFSPSLQNCSSEDVFGLICYHHAIILCARFASVIDAECQIILVQPSKKALRTLLRIWAHIEKGAVAVDNMELVRWRYTLALNEVLPFSDSALCLPAPQDTLSLLTSNQYVGVSPAIQFLRRSGELPKVEGIHVEHLALHLETLCTTDDLRGIDEFVWALRLSRHSDLSTLQSAFRPLSWRLHGYMNPRAPCILDSMLTHPLALWVGSKRKECSSYRARYADLGLYSTDGIDAAAEVRDFPHISRLRFGFGRLATTTEVGRFICAWSIMYQCLQYTPDPLKDHVYAMLFADHARFSFSQLCHRLKQVLRTLLDVPDLPEFSLDGFDERYRHIAGLGVLEIVDDSEERILRLRQEIEGLSCLEKDIHKWTQ